MTRKDRILQNFLVGLFGTTAFVSIAIFSLTWVNGLTYDRATGSFEQTSVIALEAKIKDVSVFVNDEFISESLPLNMRSLSPGSYRVVIERKNYQTIEKTFILKAGELGFMEDIVMVANKPLITRLNDDYRFVDVNNTSAGLSLIDGELYDGGNFITRFSNVPQKIYRLNFSYLYLVSNELRVFMPETNQDFLAASTLEKDVLINVKPFSWSFAVLDGDNKYLVNVAESSEVSPSSLQ